MPCRQYPLRLCHTHKMTLDLRSMFHTWVTVLTKPGEQFFEAERLKQSATLSTALIWMVLAGAVVILLELLQAQLYPSSPESMLPSEVRSPSEFLAILNSIPQRSTTQILTGIVTTPVSFIVSVAIQHLVASLLGSDRIRLEPSGETRSVKFGRYAYLNATFGAPFAIAMALVSLVPFLICLAVFILSIYQLVLAYFATRVEYVLPRGRAIFVILIGPLIVGGGTALVGGTMYNFGFFG